MEGEKGTAVHVETFRVCGSDVGPSVEETGTKEVEETGTTEEVGKRRKWGPLGFEVRNPWTIRVASRKACRNGSPFSAKPFV
jgi:hypothetical protein